MSNQVTGVVRIKIDGELVESKEGAKFSGINMVEREEQMSSDGVAGFSEKPVVPMIECTLIHKASLNLTAIGAITNSTIFFECDTGKVYALYEAWCATALDLTGGGGEVPVTFKGRRAEEIS